ncbi:MAG: CoB--CoM heterodisulfide reductase iron-sulfur subunit A family protein [Bacteroidetes bacterium]|nr:CoB--CoM heterodisulfide reductase iron-sulfur subunit A family protein [Bacteroidota bacterium]
MKKIPVTGVYFHYYTNGHAESINFLETENYIKKIPGVIILGNSNELPPIDKQLFIKKIQELHIERLVIAGYSPGMVKTFFTSAMLEAGQDAEKVLIAGFNEYGAIKKSDTELAKIILHFTIAGLSLDDISTYSKKPVNENTLVIGGGIAGIQASIEIANSKHKVYLLEQTGTIGGHMAMFDKTFPTLDCAACILTPKMVEVGQHPFIELMTYCEVIGVTGEHGDFKVKVLKKARRVDLADCIGCGICSEKCPAKTPSEFDAGTTLRKAIYIPFPQAVPNKYLIDAEHCIYVENGKCGVCVKVCPADAVILDQLDEEVEINVGNIVLATGFSTFDARRAENFGYGKLPNVLTSLEFERLVNASGPTEGNITFRTIDKKGNPIFTNDSKSPQSVALIHCIGSRDLTYNQYCSKVCCMYSLKLAHLVKEKLPDAEVYEYYIDMRAYGKGYEEFYERIKGEGVHIIRGRTAKIEQTNDKLLLRSEDIENNRLIEQLVDMAILSVGIEPRADSNSLAEMLEIVTDNYGWYIEENSILNTTNTNRPGITLAGVCQGPKDIPDTVVHASAAAAKVIQNIILQKTKKAIDKVMLSEIETTLKD